MVVRVILLTQWFDPEPTFKGLVFARELRRQGFEVEVITGFPNYPAGKVYPGYRIKILQRELVDGVEITRVPLYPNHDQSAIKRVLNYVSFAGSALTYGLFKARRADVIYAYHPPLTVGIAASLIRLFRRTPVIYDVQDMWPDTLRATGMLSNKHALKLVGGVCSWVYRHVDRIVVLSPGFRQLLIARGVPDSKVEVIYNWADEASLSKPSGALPAAFAESAPFRIMFAGNMGKAQGLDAVLDAAAILERRGSHVRFLMLGGGVEVERLKERVKSEKLSNIEFLPAVPMSEVGTLLAAADALLVHLRKDPLFRVTIPSKTQAYMAVGKPLLMAVDGDAADLVLRSGGGVVAESENAVALADAALALAGLPAEELAAMGIKAQKYYYDHLAVTAGVSKFACIMKSLAVSGLSK